MQGIFFCSALEPH